MLRNKTDVISIPLFPPWRYCSLHNCRQGLIVSIVSSKIVCKFRISHGTSQKINSNNHFIVQIRRGRQDWTRYDRNRMGRIKTAIRTMFKLSHIYAINFCQVIALLANFTLHFTSKQQLIQGILGLPLNFSIERARSYLARCGRINNKWLVVDQPLEFVPSWHRPNTDGELHSHAENRVPSVRLWQTESVSFETNLIVNY